MPNTDYPRSFPQMGGGMPPNMDAVMRALMAMQAQQAAGAPPPPPPPQPPQPPQQSARPMPGSGVFDMMGAKPAPDRPMPPVPGPAGAMAASMPPTAPPAMPPMPGAKPPIPPRPGGGSPMPGAGLPMPAGGPPIGPPMSGPPPSVGQLSSPASNAMAAIGRPGVNTAGGPMPFMAQGNMPHLPGNTPPAAGGGGADWSRMLLDFGLAGLAGGRDKSGLETLGAAGLYAMSQKDKRTAKREAKSAGATQQKFENQMAVAEETRERAKLTYEREESARKARIDIAKLDQQAKDRRFDRELRRDIERDKLEQRKLDQEARNATQAQLAEIKARQNRLDVDMAWREAFQEAVDSVTGGLGDPTPEQMRQAKGLASEAIPDARAAARFMRQDRAREAAAAIKRLNASALPPEEKARRIAEIKKRMQAR